MEINLEINTSDRCKIYGVLNKLDDRESDNLIIFVHGITGSKDEHQYLRAPEFFNIRGYDTFRFDLYSDLEKGRGLIDCNIQIHSIDLSNVLDYFKLKYQKIYLVGHSLGCTVVLNTDISIVKKTVFWDPTAGMKSLEDHGCEYNQVLKKYILNWARTILINSKMVHDWKDASDISKQILKMTKPTKFIFAQNSGLYEEWKPFLDKTNYEVFLINNATHMFVEEGAIQVLYTQTINWFNKS